MKIATLFIIYHYLHFYLGTSLVVVPKHSKEHNSKATLHIKTKILILNDVCIFTKTKSYNLLIICHSVYAYLGI